MIFISLVGFRFLEVLHVFVLGLCCSPGDFWPLPLVVCLVFFLMQCKVSS